MENCVYTNPNFDYRKSRHLYNLKHSHPRLLETEAMKLKYDFKKRALKKNIAKSMTNGE
jgi:hypothetical protein